VPPALARALDAEACIKRRSLKESVTRDDDIYLAAMGELGPTARRSGGDRGSLSPMAATTCWKRQADCAVLYGPDMANFQAVAEELGRANAAIACADGAALEAAIGRLLGDDEARTALAKAAKSVADAHRDVVDRVVERLRPLLDRLASRSRT
jgi:3-deoxy-D-manno-octulosonic-acid transferase